MCLQDCGNETTYFETIYGAKKKKITREIRKYLEMSGNENATYQNLWYMAKMVLTGKFLAINMFKKTQECFQSTI